MKKILLLNSLFYGSTGTIMKGIACEAKDAGHDVAMAVSHVSETSYSECLVYSINSKFGDRMASVLSKLTGLEGCFSIFSTLNFISKIKKFSPDIIHLHNLHHSYINLPMFFRYLKKSGVQVVWTLHDCWSFTGHCPHFSYERCEKWKDGCFRCPRYISYPKSIYDNSRFMWKWKKKWFTDLPNLTLVAPSKWLANFVKESFMSKYPLQVIYSGIDLSVFKPTNQNVREIYKIEDKKIVLGVASTWSVRKGLDIFIELSKRLPKEYQIILVGTNDDIDTQIPSNIISVHRTENQTQLAAFYTVADVFVNPTREEVFGLVNVEALACGTPVITFQTGGSPEAINNECGSVIPVDDINSLEFEILRVCKNDLYPSDACMQMASCFEQRRRLREYIEIYES